MAELEHLISVKWDASKLNSGADRSTKKVKELGRQADITTREFSKMSRVAAGLAAALTTAQITRYADAFTNAENAIKLTVESAGELSIVMDKVLGVANRSLSPLESTAKLYGAISRSTGQLGLTTQKALDITETIGKSFVVSGANAEGARGAITQLIQAFDSGILRGEEFNSVNEQAPLIMTALQRQLNATKGEMRDLAEQGKITVAIMVKALDTLKKEVDKKIGDAEKSFSGKLGVAANNIAAFVGNSSFISGAVSKLGDGIVSLSNNLDTLSDAALLFVTILTARQAPALLAATVAIMQKATASSAAAAANLAMAASENESALAAVNSAKADIQAAAAAKAAASADVIATDSALAKAKADQAATAATLKLASTEAKTSSIIVLSDAKELASKKALTAAKSADKVATTALNAARVQSVAANNALTTSTNALTASNAALSQVQLKTALTTNALAAATGRMTVMARIATTAAAGLRGALALVGGPLGAAFLAAAGIAYYISTLEDAADKTKRLQREQAELIAKFRELGDVERRIEVDKAQRQQQASIKREADLRAQIKGAQDRIKSLRELGLIIKKVMPTGGFGPAIEFETGKTDEAAAEFERLSGFLNTLSTDLEKTESKTKKLTDSLSNLFESGLPTKNEFKEPVGVPDSKAIDRFKMLTKEIEQELKIRAGVRQGFLHQGEAQLYLSYARRKQHIENTFKEELRKSAGNDEKKRQLEQSHKDLMFAIEAQYTQDKKDLEENRQVSFTERLQRETEQLKNEMAIRAGFSGFNVGESGTIGDDMADEQIAFEENQLMRQEQFEAEMQRLQENDNARKELQIAFGEREFLIEQSHKERMNELTRKAEAERAKLIENVEKRIFSAKQSSERKLLSLTQQAFGKSKGFALLKLAFETKKAIAQVKISTASALIQATQASPLTAGEPFATAIRAQSARSMALIGASAIVQGAGIVKGGGGSAGGGGSFSAGTGEQGQVQQGAVTQVATPVATSTKFIDVNFDNDVVAGLFGPVLEQVLAEVVGNNDEVIVKINQRTTDLIKTGDI